MWVQEWIIGLGAWAMGGCENEKDVYVWACVREGCSWHLLSSAPLGILWPTFRKGRTTLSRFMKLLHTVVTLLSPTLYCIVYHVVCAHYLCELNIHLKMFFPPAISASEQYCMSERNWQMQKPLEVEESLFKPSPLCHHCLKLTRLWCPLLCKHTEETL